MFTVLCKTSNINIQLSHIKKQSTCKYECLYLPAPSKNTDNLYDVMIIRHPEYIKSCHAQDFSQS